MEEEDTDLDFVREIATALRIALEALSAYRETDILEFGDAVVEAEKTGITV